ncbi:hypothetical protein LWI28_010333 [Acer negundo]|uniref:Uncharacterized protein n=1 Tax=Acer negundo TaxID=4023 RepID=A0AAD5IDG1_ACENE|nr:hypothetical protein LWI28_010333 [Acer negundo]
MKASKEKQVDMDERDASEARRRHARGIKSRRSFVSIHDPKFQLPHRLQESTTMRGTSLPQHLNLILYFLGALLSLLQHGHNLKEFTLKVDLFNGQLSNSSLELHDLGGNGQFFLFV